MTLQSMYRVVLIMARRDGWMVREVELPNDRMGDIEVDKRLIRIDAKLRVGDKLTTLAHEYFGHGEQYEEVRYHLANKRVAVSKTKLDALTRYQGYLITGIYGGKYSRAKLAAIQFCEVDASRRAQEWLIKLFPETKKMFRCGILCLEELGSKKDLAYLRKGWRETEFDD